MRSSAADGATAQAGGGQACKLTEPPDLVLSLLRAFFLTLRGNEIWAGWEDVGAVAASFGGLGTSLSSNSKSPAEIRASPRHRSPRISLRQTSTTSVHFGACHEGGTS